MLSLASCAGYGRPLRGRRRQLFADHVSVWRSSVRGLGSNMFSQILDHAICPRLDKTPPCPLDLASAAASITVACLVVG
jgi:hypothetical protein